MWIMQIKSILQQKKISILFRKVFRMQRRLKSSGGRRLECSKNTKTTTSKENQNILADFSAKLPYTRLGSMEYTQAYQFIAKPVALMMFQKKRKR